MFDTKTKPIAVALLTTSVVVFGLLMLAGASAKDTTIPTGDGLSSAPDESSSGDALSGDALSGDALSSDATPADSRQAASESADQAHGSSPEYLQTDGEGLSDAFADPASERPDADAEAEDPEVVEGPPGVVSGNTEIPVVPPPLPPAPMEAVALTAVPKPTAPVPTIDPIDIVEVGGNGPGAAGPKSELAVPTGGSSDQFAPNVSGCALQCVQRAALSPNVSTPNLGLDVEATVPARIDISLTNSETGKQSLFTSSGFKTLWSTTLSPLAPATEYDLVLEAIDEEGQRQVHTHTFTTRAPLANPGGLQDNEPGCAGTCITRATVTPTDRHDEVRFDIETNSPAAVKVWMSTSEPGWIGDSPVLPDEAIVEPTTGVRTDFSVEKAFLDPETRYHVVVRAEDEYGVDYQVGDFTTTPPPPVNVRLTFEQIFVRWDGDPRALDRGELSFAWGLDDGDLDWTDTIGSRSQEKMHGGRIIDLYSDNEVWLTLDQDDEFLAPGVTAVEADNPPGFDFGGAGLTSVVQRPINHHGYGRTNPAWGYPLTPNSIKAMQTCGDMGFTNAPADDYCVSIFSPASNDKQYPQIQAIVSYHFDQ